MHHVSTMSAQAAVRPNSGCGSSVPNSSGNCQSQKGDFNATLRSAMAAYSSKDCKPLKEEEPNTEPQEETNVSTAAPPETKEACNNCQPKNQINVVERQIVLHRVIVPVRHAQVVHVVPIHHNAPYRLIVPQHNFHHGPHRFSRNDPELDSYAMQLAKEMGMGKDAHKSLKKFFDALQELLDKGIISRNDVIDFVKSPPKMHRFKGNHLVEFASASELFEKLWGKEGRPEKGEKSEKAFNSWQ